MSRGPSGVTLQEDEIDLKARALVSATFNGLNVGARAFVVYDDLSKDIIFSKNELAQLPLASLTKIMSTVVALDLANENTIIDIKVPQDKFFGRWKLKDLLKLVLVSSSNSGINTISERLLSMQDVSLNGQWFVKLMNKKAKTLGLDQSYFLNESGLDIDGTLSGAYGSPLDVAILFSYALKISPEIFESTKYSSITVVSEDNRIVEVENTNRTVSLIEGLVASKTGLTDLADGNLAVVTDIAPGHRIIIVVFGSTEEGRFRDVEALSRATRNYNSLVRE